jgi:hypothetical protein
MFSLLPPKVARLNLAMAALGSFAPLQAAVTEAVEAKLIKGDALTITHLIWAEFHGLVSLHNANKLNFGHSLAQLSRRSLLDHLL